jgi:hypothetical protein
MEIGKRLLRTFRSKREKEKILENYMTATAVFLEHESFDSLDNCKILAIELVTARRNFICRRVACFNKYQSGVALGYRLDDQRSDSRQALRIFLFTTVSRLALEPTQPPIQCVPGAFPWE